MSNKEVLIFNEDMMNESDLAALPSENIGAIISDSFEDIYTPMVEVVSPLPMFDLFAIEDAVSDEEAWESNILMKPKSLLED